MIELIIVLLSLTLGYVAGYTKRDLNDKIAELSRKIQEDKTPPPKPGVTLGSYRHVDEVNTAKPVPKARGRVINPKTPQRVEWDSEQQLKEENMKFRVGPK